MRKISLWAKNHKLQARLSIVIIYILLNGLGIITGILLHELKITFSTVVLSSLTGIFLSAVFLYPSKYEKGEKLSRQKFYIKQKSCDFILAASTFCVVIFLGNRPDKFFFSTSIIHATVLNPTRVNDSVKAYKTITSFSASMKDANGKLLKWKERKKLLKEQVREIKGSNELSTGSKIVLIILSAVVAAALLYLVAALSCTLSCSGSDGAALLVGIGGLALVIFLLVIAIRAINGKKGKKKQKDAHSGKEG
jgi:uncharacterized membrane protein